MMTPKPCRKHTPALKLFDFAFLCLPVMLTAVIGTVALAKHFLNIPIKIVVYVYFYAKAEQKSQPFPGSFCAVISNASCCCIFK